MPVPKIFSAFTLAALVASAPVRAAETASPAGLVARFAPKFAGAFVFETIPAQDGRDAYEIESAGGKIVLRGNSGVAQASAFYRYLTQYCHAQVTWNGDNLALPATPPVVPEKLRVVSPVKTRMAYNYCTHGYSMPFDNEADWDREIDWLALHGVNAALIIEGQDAVWQNAFVKFGYTREEMRRWLCAPTHQPWQFMGNMEGFLPPPQSMIDRRAKLGRHIADRLRAFGIRPVLQGYYGMLPSGYAAKNPSAKIVPQGGWAGGNRRPDFLNPDDPVFPEIARTFLEEQKKIFGECELFAADPFHEGGTSKGMNRGVVYKRIQDTILAFEPKAVLVKQCWQTSNKEMFDAGDKERSLALDLWCDVRPFWQNAKGYDGTPWTWCMLFNFGGNLAFEANLPHLAKAFGDALGDPARGRLEGTGLVPEGTRTNPMVYELMSDMGWRGAPADLKVWVNDYLFARYGSRNAEAESAWSIVLKTAYASPQHEGSPNSVITGRPSLNKNLKGRTWAPGSKVSYSSARLADAWEKMLAAAPALGDRDTFRHDLADITRQQLCNRARPVFEAAVDAINAGDRAALKKRRDEFLGLLADIDAITGTRAEWLMGSWVQRAGKFSPENRAYAEHAARLLLTSWMTNPETDLADYANREWNGLTGEYYAGRWKLFFGAADAALADGKKFDAKAFAKTRSAFDKSWIESTTNTMLTAPQGDTVALSRKFFEKYAPVIRASEPKPLPMSRESVIGAWKFTAEGRSLVREFRADGTVVAYDTADVKQNWFDGFTWKISDDTLELTRGSQVITLRSTAPDTLDFVSEGFGRAVRTTAPAK